MFRGWPETGGKKKKPFFDPTGRKCGRVPRQDRQFFDVPSTDQRLPGTQLLHYHYHHHYDAIKATVTISPLPSGPLRTWAFDHFRKSHEYIGSRRGKLPRQIPIVNVCVPFSLSVRGNKKHRFVVINENFRLSYSLRKLYVNASVESSRFREKKKNQTYKNKTLPRSLYRVTRM